jgi:hypothetical protein
MGHRLLLFWLIVGVSSGFSDEIKNPWTQPCRYVTQHDPVTIVMDGDRGYAVRYPPRSWSTVSSWSEGRELTLCYAETTGAALRDHGTDLILPLVGWPNDGHPIDLILSLELSKTVTTQDECEVYERAAKRWEMEVVRAFDLLATCSESGPDEVARVAAAKKAWTNYSGYDPETGISGGQTGSGLILQQDSFDFPTLRTFTLSFSTRF